MVHHFKCLHSPAMPSQPRCFTLSSLPQHSLSRVLQLAQSTNPAAWGELKGSWLSSFKRQHCPVCSLQWRPGMYLGHSCLLLSWKLLYSRPVGSKLWPSSVLPDCALRLVWKANGIRGEDLPLHSHWCEFISVVCGHPACQRECSWH